MRLFEVPNAQIKTLLINGIILTFLLSSCGPRESHRALKKLVENTAPALEKQVEPANVSAPQPIPTIETSPNPSALPNPSPIDPPTEKLPHQITPSPLTTTSALPSPEPSPIAPSLPSPLPLPSPIPIPSETPKLFMNQLHSITGRWTRNEKTQIVTRALETKIPEVNSFQASNYITLPADVPASIEVAIEATLDPHAVSKLSIEANAVTAESPVQFKLDTGKLNIERLVEKNKYLIRTTLNGLRNLLSSSRESLIFLNLEIKNAGTQIFKLATILRTPPSQITAIHENLEKFEARKSSPIPEKFKTLSSQALRLDLIQLITLRNTSSEAVEVTLPTELDSALEVKAVYHLPESKKKPKELDRSEWIEEQESTFFDTTTSFNTNDPDGYLKIFLLPIEDNLPTTWPKIMGNIQKDNFTATIQPAAEAVFGVYLWSDSGEVFPEALPQEYPKIESMLAVTYHTCNSFNHDAINRLTTNVCPALKAEPKQAEKCQAFSKHCSACISTNDLPSCTKCYQLSIDVEYMYPFLKIPSGYQKICSNNDWTSIKQYRDFKIGEESYPINLLIKKKSQSLYTRFAGNKIEEDPESRPIPALAESSLLFDKKN